MSSVSQATFNLVSEPWIPVEFESGVVTEVSLSRVFSDASSIKRILHPSPVVTVGLYRLLFAVFHRAQPFESVGAWLDAWEEMRAYEGVNAYLQKWQDRFDLFHPTQPFWQVHDLVSTKSVLPWTKLRAESNDNNSKVWLDHTVTSREPVGTTPANAARLLVATQVMSLGAGKSSLGMNRNSPVATCMMVIPEGRNLAETLLANVCFLDGDDSAVWERVPDRQEDILGGRGKERSFWGVADRLTWLTRAIRILPPDDDGLVRFVRFASGHYSSRVAVDRDPWVPYVTDKKRNLLRRTWPMDRIVWTNVHALLPTDEAGGAVPLVLQKLRWLHHSGRTPPVWSILIAGQAASQARIDHWGLERWSLPASAFADGSTVVHALLDAAKVTQFVSVALRKAAEGFVRNSVVRSEKMKRSVLDRSARSLPLIRVTGSELEFSYAEFLERLTSCASTDRARLQSLWGDRVIAAVREGFTATLLSTGRDARALEACVRCEAEVDAILRRVRVMAPAVSTEEATRNSATTSAVPVNEQAIIPRARSATTVLEGQYGR